MLNLVFGLGAAPPSRAVPVTNLHIELRASRQLKRIIFSDLAKNVKIFNDDDKIKFRPLQESGIDVISFPQ